MAPGRGGLRARRRHGRQAPSVTGGHRSIVSSAPEASSDRRDLRILSAAERFQSLSDPNRYVSLSFWRGALSTHWTALNPAIGALRGRFVIAGDAILSFYANPTGRYRGFECIQQRDPARYSVRGSLLEEDKLVSLWVLELTRA